MLVLVGQKGLEESLVAAAAAAAASASTHDSAVVAAAAGSECRLWYLGWLYSERLPAHEQG